MEDLKLDINRIHPFITGNAIESMIDETNRCLDKLHNGKVKGSDFLGWLGFPSREGRELAYLVEQKVEPFREKADVVVVTGIGGSYLGARAVIDSLSHSFASMKRENGSPQIFFAGHNISEDYLSELIEILNEKSCVVVVISKSGTTTEPAIAFRILRNHLKMKYGEEESRRRIIAITDPSAGALRKMAEEEGFTSFSVPRDVGGRFSVLTAVGLVPIALAGFSIERLIEGAGRMEEVTGRDTSCSDNPSAMYALVRNALYRAGKKIEILATTHPGMFFFGEWWKQLFGESEGKDNRGIFPAAVNYTADLHSMGQYIQDGERHLFETFLTVNRPGRRLLIPREENDSDGLNYIAGKRMSDVQKMAESGTMLAHYDGGVPLLHIEMPLLNEYYLGQLIYFFEMGCAVSGMLLDVNPFDQPGVEAYKNNMFALLNKPGFESRSRKISDRLKG